MPKNNRVYIIGFMGSGKTTAGKRLAASLGWTFVDLDRKIEEIARQTIPQIFTVKGEEHFRKLESETLKGITGESGLIVSTGGGTPCHGDNMDYMLETGLTVYLKMTPEQLTTRLLRSSGERPLIKNVPDDKLQEFIKEKLAIREKWYGRANIIIQGINLDISLLLSFLRSEPRV